MAYTNSELQALITAGYVPSTSGTSEITSQMILNGARKVYFEPNAFTWTGSSASWPFAIDNSVSSPYPIIFNGVDVVSAVDGSPIVKQVAQDDQPDHITFVDCDFTVLGAPAIDFNNLDYTVLPTFRNMVTRGSGAIRLRASGGADYWHGTSQMTIRGWTHIGSNRWGPAFNFRGCSGLIMENVSDTGSMALHSTLLAAGWTGPLSLLHQAVRTPNTYTNFTVDYDEVNDDTAPNCYIGEIRTDLDTGTGQHEFVHLINPTLRHAAIDAAVKPWRFMGSNDNAAHSLIIRLVDADSPAVEDFELGGRMSLWIDRPHYKNGESSKLTALQSAVGVIFPVAVSFQDPICTADGKLPGSDFGTLVTYTGSQNETDFETAPLQPEDVLA